MSEHNDKRSAEEQAAQDKFHARLRYFFDLYRALDRPLGRGVRNLRIWMSFETYTTRN